MDAARARFVARSTLSGANSLHSSDVRSSAEPPNKRGHKAGEPSSRHARHNAGRRDTNTLPPNCSLGPVQEHKQ